MFLGNGFGQHMFNQEHNVHAGQTNVSCKLVMAAHLLQIVHVLCTSIFEVSLKAVCLEVLITENYGHYLILDVFLNTRHEFGTQDK